MRNSNQNCKYISDAHWTKVEIGWYIVIMHKITEITQEISNIMSILMIYK